MSDGAHTPESVQNTGLRSARAEIAAELGPDELARLHEEKPLLDAVAVCGSLALFLGLAYALAVGSIRDPLWWACLFLQGNMILLLAMVSHDAFTHRKWLAPRLRWLVSTLMLWPSQLRPSVYDDHHLTHHRALGTPNDTESYKHGIDTRLRRILFATPAMLVQHVLMMRRRSAAATRSDQGQARSERIAYESKVRWAILAAVAVIAVLDSRLVLYGYIVPFVFVLPLLNTVRIVLEHFDLDDRNPFWVGTFYRTGPVTRIMFWWIGGDCHVVHHFYATIPWYRLPRAIRLIRPILLRHGVFEHRSLARLLLDWFAARRPHWSVPAAAQALPERRGPIGAAPKS
jgi:fatty acid desaturase